MSDAIVAARARDYVTERRHMEYHEAESGSASGVDRAATAVAYTFLKSAVDAEDTPQRT